MHRVHTSKNKDDNVIIEDKGKRRVSAPMRSQGSKIFVIKNVPNLGVKEEVGTCQRN
jgi:hypothetical protein